MPTTPPTPIAQKEQQFKAKLKALIERFGYQDGIGMLQWDLKGSEIVGKFADRNGSKAFEFSVNGEGIAYKPLTGVAKQDAYIRGLSATLLGAAPRTGAASSSYLAGFRVDAKGGKRNCTSPTAYSCGASCISRNKQCRIRDIKVRQASAVMVSEARLVDRQIKEQGISQKELDAIVTAEEEKIRDLKHERIVVIDPKSGRVPLRKDGDERYVTVSHGEGQAMRGKIVTHNHPNVYGGKPGSELHKGLSFSDADVNLACVVDAAEVRAVSTGGYTHSIKPPPGGWNREFYYRKVEPSYKQNSEIVYRDLAKEINQGNTSAEDAEVDFHHRVWTRTAKDTGMTYSRTEVKRSAQRRAA